MECVGERRLDLKYEGGKRVDLECGGGKKVGSRV